MNQDIVQASPQALLQGMPLTGQQHIKPFAADMADALRQAEHALSHVLATAQSWLAGVWLNLTQAAEASRPLLDALKLWFQHMTPSTSQSLADAALVWIAQPAVQHVLMGGATLAMLALLLRTPRHTTAGMHAGLTQRHGAASWQRGAGLAGTAAAIGAASAVAADEILRAHDDLEANWIRTPQDSSTLHDLGMDMGCAINPATGLPMVDGTCAGMDVMGNPYGFDLHDSFSTDHSFSGDHDSFTTSYDSFSHDSFDSWSSGSSWD